MGTRRGCRAFAQYALCEIRHLRLVFTLRLDQLGNVKPGIRNHPQVRLVPLPGRGEIPVAEDRVRRIQCQRLELPEIDLASSRHTDIRATG